MAPRLFIGELVIAGASSFLIQDFADQFGGSVEVTEYNSSILHGEFPWDLVAEKLFDDDTYRTYLVLRQAIWRRYREVGQHILKRHDTSPSFQWHPGRTSVGGASRTRHWALNRLFIRCYQDMCDETGGYPRMSTILEANSMRPVHDAAIG